MAAASKGEAMTVAKLLSRGAEVNAARKDGWTALMLAADDDHADVAAVLLANDADRDAKNDEGETAFEIAESWDNEDTIEVLKQAGAARPRPRHATPMKDGGGTTKDEGGKS